MKIEYSETDGRMWIELHAENMKDAAFITRMKNLKKASISSESYACEGGEFFVFISGNKRHNADGKVRS